jgi:hypothetical protein
MENNMIESILTLLNEKPYYGVSKEIDFAKGSHKLPNRWSELKTVMLRNFIPNWIWRKSK